MDTPDVDRLAPILARLEIERAAVSAHGRSAHLRIPADQAAALASALGELSVALTPEDRLWASFTYQNQHTVVDLQPPVREYVIAISQAALDHDAAAGTATRLDDEDIIRVPLAEFADVVLGSDREWRDQYDVLRMAARTILRSGTFGAVLVASPEADILATLLLDRCANPATWSAAVEYLARDPQVLAAARSLAQDAPLRRVQAALPAADGTSPGVAW